MIIKNILPLLFSTLFIACQSNSSKAFVPESNGNMNALTIVMSKSSWGENLGKQVKTSLMVPYEGCLLYTSPSPRDVEESRMPSSA